MVLVTGLCNVLFQYFESTHKQRIHIRQEIYPPTQMNQKKSVANTHSVSVGGAQPATAPSKDLHRIFIFFWQKYFKKYDITG